MAPQIIYLALVFIGLLMSANRHGQSKKPGEHNFWVDLTNYIIGAGLLYWGGFFDNLLK